MNPNRPRLIPELLSKDQVPCSKGLISDRQGNFGRTSKRSKGPNDGNLAEDLCIVRLVCNEGNAFLVGQVRPNHLKQNKEEEVVTALFATGFVAGHSARYVTLQPMPHTPHEALGNRASSIIILENHLTEGDIISP
jgi:hypothetical protein